MEIGILIPLILTILILLFAGIRQAQTFREKEKFHEIQMQQMARSFAAERKVFIRRETRLRKKLREKVSEVIHLKSQRPFSRQPTYIQAPPEVFQDSGYWRVLSEWYRREQDWICEGCGIDLGRRTEFLDTHHIRGRAYNSPEDLIALCVRCHSDQTLPTNHGFMKDSPRYKKFMKWARLNGLSDLAPL